MDRQIHPTYAKIRHTRSEIKGFGTIVPEILSEICEYPTDAKFSVLLQMQMQLYLKANVM